MRFVNGDQNGANLKKWSVLLVCTIQKAAQAVQGKSNYKVCVCVCVCSGPFLKNLNCGPISPQNVKANVSPSPLPRPLSHQLSPSEQEKQEMCGARDSTKEPREMERASILKRWAGYVMVLFLDIHNLNYSLFTYFGSSNFSWFLLHNESSWRNRFVQLMSCTSTF